jgi:ketosteroid isomerase-like protein
LRRKFHEKLPSHPGAFKAGFNKLDATVDDAWQVDNDTPAAMGKFHVTGRNDKGDALDASGIWTAVYVKVDDKWKIRMLAHRQLHPRKTDR